MIFWIRLGTLTTDLNYSMNYMRGEHDDIVCSVCFLDVAIICLVLDNENDIK